MFSKTTTTKLTSGTIHDKLPDDMRKAIAGRLGRHGYQHLKLFYRRKTFSEEGIGSGWVVTTSLTANVPAASEPVLPVPRLTSGRLVHRIVHSVARV